jgi:hypothetical protein
VEHLREVARSAGFAAEGPHELSKRLLIESDDPAVAAHDVEVRLVFDGCDRAAGLDGAGDSIRRTAIASLRHKPGDLVRPRLTVAVHGLESDEILACLAARVGRADHDVLFRATALADAVRRLGAGSLAVSVDPAIDAGVAAAGACFPSLPLVPPTGSVAPPLFVWARHGDRSADAPELRRAYFVAFTVSRLTGFRQRLAYLVRHSVRITRLAAVVGLRAVPRRRRPGNPRDHAYWSHPLDDA